MKTIAINYAFGKSIEVVVPRKKAGQESFVESFVRGSMRRWEVEVVDGLEDFIKYVIEHANDYSGNRGNWYAHTNGFCMDAIIKKGVRETRIISINSYRGSRRSALEAGISPKRQRESGRL